MLDDDVTMTLPRVHIAIPGPKTSGIVVEDGKQTSGKKKMHIIPVGFSPSFYLKNIPQVSSINKINGPSAQTNRVSGAFAVNSKSKKDTLSPIIMEVENGSLEDDFSLQGGHFPLP